MQSLLFNLAIDWVMRQATRETNGIEQSLLSMLEDLDFADDLAQAGSDPEQNQVAQQICESTWLQDRPEEN